MEYSKMTALTWIRIPLFFFRTNARMYLTHDQRKECDCGCWWLMIMIVDVIFVLWSSVTALFLGQWRVAGGILFLGTIIMFVAYCAMELMKRRSGCGIVDIFLVCFCLLVWSSAMALFLGHTKMASCIFLCCMLIMCITYVFAPDGVAR